jgi:Protein of unknown function (DUF3349)
MGMRALIPSVVAFLRAGYPQGAPARGYVPLLALLPRRVSDDEITTIIVKLRRGRRGVDSVDVGVEITRVTDELPSSNDVSRIERRLAVIQGADEL